jgi:soluble lytic murein transglycosylase
MKHWTIIFSAILFGASTAWGMSADQTFAHAQNSYQSKNAKALAEDASQLHSQNYILAPYADYWLMLITLSTADKAVVRDFLSQYADYPFADRVRGEWLKSIGKRQDWDTFFDELPNFKREDLAVSCYALEGRAKRGDVIALTEGKVLWMSTAEHPANCENLFDLMQASKVLTQDDIWARFRLAMQEGKDALAKTIIQRETTVSKAELKLIDTVYQNPQAALEKKIIPFKSHLGRALNLYAIDKLARKKLDEGLNTWAKLMPQFETDEQLYMWGRLAMQAARRHDENALSLYAKVKNSQLDKDELAWKVRAALLERDWSLVLSTIDDMQTNQQEEQAWRYWKARAYKAQNAISKANVILVPLSREHSFYGLLAQDELGDVMSGPPSNYVPSENEVAAVESQPAMQRALELQRQDMRWESRAEWAWATKDFDDRQKLAAAELAMRQSWYDLAITTAEKTKFVHNFVLRYPAPYRETVKSFAKENGLDEAWVYGITRQESRFVTYAKSGVGASGLMQVMPATAAWIAKKTGFTDYRQSLIHQTDTNVKLGTYYLRYTLDLMSGQAAMATAAYNAGPGNARHWTPKKPIEGAIYAETIPITETRQYVQKVMANTCFYSSRLGTKSMSLKQRLGVIIGDSNPSTVTNDDSDN